MIRIQKLIESPGCRSFTTLVSVVLFSGFVCSCEKETKSSDAGATPATQNNQTLGSSNSGTDLVVTGTLAIDAVESTVKGDTGIALGNREVEVLGTSGTTFARAVTTNDGSFSVIVPGALAVGSGASLIGSSLLVQSVISNTADGSVIGTKQAIEVGNSGSRHVDMGATQLKKITAIRGKVLVDGARDHIGTSVYIPGTSYAARTDSAGQFLMTFMPAGTYDLRIEKDGYQPVNVTGVTVIENSTAKLPQQTLRVSGGTGFFSVKQLGTEGLSASRTVEFLITPGDSDRFKGGRPDEVETTPYGSVPSTFSYTFPTDGEYQLKLVFATADGFESSITKTIIVDTVAPSVENLALADRTSLNTLYTNELDVIPYHPTCNDIAAVAILPASATAPTSTDFINLCFANVSSTENLYKMPPGGAPFAYKIWARDRVGNVSAAPATGTITALTSSPEAPSITLKDQTSGSAAATNSRTVDVALSTCSGISKVLLSESQTLPPSAAALTTSCNLNLSYTFANDLEGTKVVLIWVSDAAGNVSPVSASDSIVYDYTAPTTATLTLADPTPANSGYSNSLTLDVSIGTCSGIHSVLISESQITKPAEDASGWLTCATTGLSTTASGEGNPSIFRVWTKDSAGNVSDSAGIGSIIIDTTAPSPPNLTLSDATNGGTGYTNAQIVAVGISSCADADKVYVSESSSAPNAASISTTCTTSGVSISLTSNTEETKTVYLWSKDLAGNMSSSNSIDTIVMDTTPPGLPTTFSIRDSSSSSTTHSNSTDVSFSIDSCPAGAQILIREGQSTPPSELDGNWTACSTSGSLLNLLRASQESQTVYLWTKDAAGNVKIDGSRQHSITYDTVAPNTPSFTIEDDAGNSSIGYTNNLTVDLTIGSCSDIAAVYFSESNSQPAEGTISTSCASTADHYQYTFSGSEGTKGLYLWIKDAAGNITSTYSSIYYDTSTPVVSSVKISAIGTDTVTITWSSDESAQTRVEYGTSAGVYGFAYDLAQSAGYGVNSHTAVINTNLTPGTTYFFRVASTDFAEHTGYSAEQTFKTMKLGRVFHSTNLSQLGGYFPASSINQAKRLMASCDVRGDSKDDVIIAAPNATSSSRANNGNVYVIEGSTALGGTSKTVPSSDAVLTLEGGAASVLFGMFVGCSDFNGDGKKDIFITEKSGSAYIFYGSNSSTATTIDSASSYSVKLTNLGGIESAAVGNFNGDSFGDVSVCGSTSCSILYGSNLAGGTTVNMSTNWSFRATSANSLGMGSFLADVDGDGYDDLIMSRWNAAGEDGLTSNTGGFYIKRGGAIGAGSSVTIADASGFDYAVFGSTSGQLLGIPYAGDIDGDGYKDLLLRTYGNDGDAYIVFGRPVGPTVGTDWSDDTTLSTTTLRIAGISTGNAISHMYFGGYVSVGDINGDGKGDILIGSQNSNSQQGKVCLFLGRSQAAWTTLGPDIQLSEADLCMTGPDANNLLGSSVAIGNLDGDVGNKGEIIVGAAGGAGATDSGGANGEVGIYFFEIPPVSYDQILVDLVPHF